MIESITSRKNKILGNIRLLGRERAARREQGLFVGDGKNLLQDALAAGAAVETVLWSEQAQFPLPEGVRQYILPADLLAWVSPLKNSPGPVFTIQTPVWTAKPALQTVLALEGVQDPGNVGTVLRTANALGIDLVVLTGACADLYHPKTVRATMGAVFRQPVLELEREQLCAMTKAQGLPIYGAALTDTARDVRELNLRKSCVVVGSEGKGLSPEMLEQCTGQVILPMEPDSESLNAGVAAALLMWQMKR